MSVASLVLFLLVGAGHILPAFHFAVVVHRVCAEHGELIHEVAPGASVRERGAEGPAIVAADASHQHEHCSGIAVTGSAVAIAAPGSSGHAPLGSLTETGGIERRAFQGIALLAYAPKLAPPAAIARA